MQPIRLTLIDRRMTTESTFPLLRRTERSGLLGIIAGLLTSGREIGPTLLYEAVLIVDVEGGIIASDREGCRRPIQRLRSIPLCMSIDERIVTTTGMDLHCTELVRPIDPFRPVIERHIAARVSPQICYRELLYDVSAAGVAQSPGTPAAGVEWKRLHQHHRLRDYLNCCEVLTAGRHFVNCHLRYIRIPVSQHGVVVVGNGTCGIR